MSAANQKVMQYLNEAHASEQALTRVLESQIAITRAARTAPGWKRICVRRATMPSAWPGGCRISVRAPIR